jgi:hypothetical protein
MKSTNSKKIRIEQIPQLLLDIVNFVRNAINFQERGAKNCQTKRKAHLGAQIGLKMGSDWAQKLRLTLQRKKKAHLGAQIGLKLGFPTAGDFN